MLTDHGAEQCQNLCDNFKYHDDIDLLLASPMRRTIQTCKLSFKPAVDRGQKILLMPLAQESSDTQMDTGSEVSVIREAFGDLVDTHRIEEIHPHWYKNVGKFGPGPEQQIERARMLRSFIRNRPEKNIVLVTHGSFAHAITGNFTKEGEQTTRMWDNAECRSYTFDDESGDDAKMIETLASKERRRSLTE
jgi:broad specificity phosphatase PhoE